MLVPNKAGNGPVPRPHMPLTIPHVAPGLFRVGSYNVMDGGGDGDRWPAQLKLLASQNFDILGIQEAKHWDRHGRARMHQLAEALGMQPLFAPSQHHGCHLVLLYRWPRVRCLSFEPDISFGSFHHAASRAQFTIAGMDRPLTVIHTHLHPFSPAARLVETGWLTEYANDDLFSILLGDLNTVGLTGIGADQDPADWGLVPKHLHSRHRLVLPDGTYGGCDRRAMSALIKAGYVDPPQHLGIAPPRTAGHWRRGSEPWDRRSDYVLLSVGLIPTFHSHVVLDTSRTRRLSDHLIPIVCLDFTKAGREERSHMSTNPRRPIPGTRLHIPRFVRAMRTRTLHGVMPPSLVDRNTFGRAKDTLLTDRRCGGSPALVRDDAGL